MNNQDFVRQSTGFHSQGIRSRAIWRHIHIDPPLLVGLVLLCCFGLFVLYSANDSNVEVVQRQALGMLVGLVVMFIVSQFNVHFYRSWAPSAYAAGLGLLALVLAIGVEENGAKSWIDLPGLPSFQPSEIMKIVVPLLMAWYLASRPLPPRFKHLFWSVAIILLPTALIIMQNDTGTAIMVAMSGVFVVLLAGIRWRIVIAGFVALLVASPAWYLFLAQEHQQNRILTFFNPYRDPTGAGYNIIQSQIAIGSGGVVGKGYGNGAQSHLDFIPESNTDFIFAVLAEEFGLLGVLFLISLYLFVLVRGVYIAYLAKDMFSRLLAGSITLTFFFYVFVNMAMVSGLLPVIGLPLPLISRGGTAIVTLFIGFGLLMSIQTHGRKQPA
ncbi:MAG TPA: rod shape-determining protein RodA [Gammaproteobacteria bacterium]|jgi:rod shape determining protein RodA|nr:rod shape-determining protein RodA [Gammaproteobacteria bacterium]HAJ76441.1 rod shape-determining protein RodA [Gammaproteobacteria bacterium]